jgi:hypothetical protein
MPDHLTTFAALREARAAYDAGNIELAELAAEDARMAMQWRIGRTMVFQPVLFPSRPQTDLTCLTYKEEPRSPA